MSEQLKRTLEILLADELDGRRPPDLSDAILARVANGAPRRGQVLRLPQPQTARRASLPMASWYRFAAGVLVGVLAVGATQLPWGMSPRPAEPIAHHATGKVRNGSLAWVCQPTAGRAILGDSWVAGDLFDFVPRAGDLLRASRSEPLHVEFFELGRLVCEPATCLEVKNVEWKQITGGFVVGSITVSAIVGAAQWFGQGEGTAGPEQHVVLAAPKPGDAILAATSDAASEALAAAHRRIAVLESQVFERTEAPIPEPALVPVTVDAIATGTPYDELLQQVDWSIAGKAIDGYLEAKQQIETLLAAGEEVPMELRARENRWESLLFEQVAESLEAGIPGMTVTARMHHPAVATNLLQSVLAAAGKPLDQSQRRWVTDIGRRYAVEDAKRRAGYGEDTMFLEQFVDEIEMQERFLSEQRRVLTPWQEARLSFGDLAERAGVDPFGTGYQWSKHNRAMEVRDRQHLAERATIGYAADLDLDDSQKQQLAAIVGNWTSRLPQAWFDEPMNDLDRNGRMRIDRIRGAALMQVELAREMWQGLGLTARQRGLLRELRQVIVPFAVQ